MYWIISYLSYNLSYTKSGGQGFGFATNMIVVSFSIYSDLLNVIIHMHSFWSDIAMIK